MKIILDLDTGIDDALALTYALANNKEILGITTIFGNVTTKQASINTLSLLELLKKDVPVYMGETKPLNAKEDYIPTKLMYKIHGTNGLANVSLPLNNRKQEDLSAADFIIDSANKYKENLCLICTSPLTNLAKAYLKNKEAIKKIGKIVLMSGALTVEGNCSKYAEANVYKDIEAAKIIYTSGLKLTVVGLDVTMKTIIKEDDFKIWQDINNKQSKNIYEILKYYCHNELDKDYAALHDPLAVAVALNQDLILNSLDINLTVEENGRLIGSLKDINKPKTCKYVLEVDSKAFINDFVTKIYKFLK